MKVIDFIKQLCTAMKATFSISIIASYRNQRCESQAKFLIKKVQIFKHISKKSSKENVIECWVKPNNMKSFLLDWNVS